MQKTLELFQTQTFKNKLLIFSSSNCNRKIIFKLQMTQISHCSVNLVNRMTLILILVVPAQWVLTLKVDINHIASNVLPIRNAKGAILQ
jgi:hypothetical protein